MSSGQKPRRRKSKKTRDRRKARLAAENVLVTVKKPRGIPWS